MKKRVHQNTKSWYEPIRDHIKARKQELFHPENTLMQDEEIERREEAQLQRDYQTSFISVINEVITPSKGNFHVGSILDGHLGLNTVKFDQIQSIWSGCNMSQKDKAATFFTDYLAGMERLTLSEIPPGQAKIKARFLLLWFTFPFKKNDDYSRRVGQEVWQNLVVT